jgi:hypothetical protein
VLKTATTMMDAKQLKTGKLVNTSTEDTNVLADSSYSFATYADMSEQNTSRYQK